MTKRTTGEDDVRRRVGHLESEVGDLKEGQARLEVGMSGMQGDLNIIIKKLNQPAPKKDTWGMVGAIGTILVIISSFAWITLQPIKLDVASLQETRKENNVLYLKNADTVGYNRGIQEGQQSFMLGLSDRYKELRVEVSTIKEEQSASKVSREATDNYSKETRSIIDYTLTKE